MLIPLLLLFSWIKSFVDWLLRNLRNLHTKMMRGACDARSTCELKVECRSVRRVKTLVAPNLDVGSSAAAKTLNLKARHVDAKRVGLAVWAIGNLKMPVT